ncbi:hypothetical protein CP532_4570, partial [Ophiocordyceps camponoti-leonardi (nom. inval.)]
MHCNWRELREVPRPEEFMAPMPPVLPEIHAVSTGSKDEFLRAQFFLHRYEATEVLRRAVNAYRQDPRFVDMKSVKIYRGVLARAYVVSPHRIACRLAFSPPQNEAEAGLDKPEDITPGSLVVLSTHEDGFRTKCFVGTVAPIPEDPEDAKDAGSPPDQSVIDLLWADPSDVVLDPNQKLIMLEPKSGYFESIRPIMTALQRSALLDHKIDKYLYDPHNERTPKRARYIKETPSNSVLYPDRARSLDDSQFRALNRAANDELAVIQGPPGTGKTYTSIVAIETVLKTLGICHANRIDSGETYNAPIIIAAQTNHAVDQILIKCRDLGIGKIGRLGGRSDNETIQEVSLFNLRKRHVPGAGGVAQRRRASKYQIEIRSIMTDFGVLKADQLRDFDVLNELQYKSLIKDDEWETAETDSRAENEQPLLMHRWLDEYMQQPEFRRAEQFIAREDDLHPSLRRKLRGQKFHRMEMNHLESIIRAMHCDEGGPWYHRAARLLANTNDLYHIKPADRGAVYCYLHKQLSVQLRLKVGEIIEDHAANSKDLQWVRRQDDLTALQREGVKIIGCTTTGLLKHWDLFALLGPRALLIEEAAETREANIVAALTPSIEQLILIGDHQQLTPRADMQELCQWPTRLDYSLFERLVSRNYPYCSLKVQRRMIPELREIVQTFYPDLKDHESVTSPERRKPIPGMQGCSLWWFDHTWPQHRGVSGHSFSNPKEARMIIEFTKYLVRNGVPPADITILAYYSGQRELIKSELARESGFGSLGPEFEWSVRTIDDFQGEENEIIILSLVRGPDLDGQRAKPGFVASENRAVVANSRARQGFYIFGNSQNLIGAPRQNVWRKIYSAFGRRVGSHMPIVCAPHGSDFNVMEPSDWDKVSRAGCSPLCRGKPVLVQTAKSPEKSTAQNKAALPKTSKQVDMKRPKVLMQRSPSRSRGASVKSDKGGTGQAMTSSQFSSQFWGGGSNGQGLKEACVETLQRPPPQTATKSAPKRATQTPNGIGRKSPTQSSPRSSPQSSPRSSPQSSPQLSPQRSTASSRENSSEWELKPTLVARPVITSSQLWGDSKAQTPKQAPTKSPQRSPPRSREASATRKPNDRITSSQFKSQLLGGLPRAPDRRPARYTSDQILEKGMRNMFAVRESRGASERAMSTTSAGATTTSQDSDSEDLIKF